MTQYDQPLSRHLVGPDLETHERVGSERLRDRDVRGIAPARDQHAADPRDVVARIEGVPVAADIGLEPAGEVARAIGIAEGYGELTGNPYGILKGVVDNKAFRKGSWGADIVDVLKPQPGDILIEGKRGLDAFPSTNLDFILRSKGIKTVVLGGFLTNCCVESTMRSAYERGFDVITLQDCTAALSREAQEMAFAHNFGMFSRPMTHDAFLDLLA